MYDAIIAGAGPAGLMAARALKSKNILIIDPKKEIGLPLRCGEGIAAHKFQEIFGRTNFPFVKNRPTRHRIIYGPLIREFGMPMLELDRPSFEKWLAEPIKGALRLGESVRDVSVLRDSAKVMTDKGTYQAKLVILAHGAHYAIQERLGLMDQDPFILACVGGIYRCKNADPNTFTYVFDEKNKGYFWIFPKSTNLVNAGIGGFVRRTRGLNLMSLLEQHVKEHLGDAEKVSQYSGIVPAAAPIKSYSDRVMVCGNAANHVIAGTGEGIYFALKGGSIAGQTALEALEHGRADSGFLERYQRRWKKEYGKALRFGIQFRDIIALGYKYGALGGVFSGPSDDELHRMLSDEWMPPRAVAFWRIARLFGMLRSTERKRLPKSFLLTYKAVKAFLPRAP